MIKSDKCDVIDGGTWWNAICVDNRIYFFRFLVKYKHTSVSEISHWCRFETVANVINFVEQRKRQLSEIGLRIQHTTLRIGQSIWNVILLFFQIEVGYFIFKEMYFYWCPSALRESKLAQVAQEKQPPLPWSGAIGLWPHLRLGLLL